MARRIRHDDVYDYRAHNDPLHHDAYHIYDCHHIDDPDPVVHHHSNEYGGDDIHHTPVDHRRYNNDLFVAHHDHLVPFDNDDEYLYDPIHHYVFDNDHAAEPTTD